MQRHKFITTIKVVTGGKKKSLVGFLVPIKSTTTPEGEKKENKREKNPKESREQVKT